MASIKVFAKDILEIDDFYKYGDHFRKVASYPDRNVFVFERNTCTEVVKGKRHVNPDGSEVFTYPSSEDFGRLGYCITNYRCKDKIIEWLVNNPDKWNPQDLYEFKKSL